MCLTTSDSKCLNTFRFSTSPKIMSTKNNHLTTFRPLCLATSDSRCLTTSDLLKIKNVHKKWLIIYDPFCLTTSDSRCQCPTEACPSNIILQFTNVNPCSIPLIFDSCPPLHIMTARDMLYVHMYYCPSDYKSSPYEIYSSVC